MRVGPADGPGAESHLAKIAAGGVLRGEQRGALGAERGRVVEFMACHGIGAWPRIGKRCQAAIAEMKFSFGEACLQRQQSGHRKGA